MSPLFLQCQRSVNCGAVETLRTVIEENDFDPREAEMHGRTLLMFAVAPLAPRSTSSSLEIIRILLETGADPNQKDAEGWSAMHFAARDNTEILNMLLAAGGDPHAPDPYGNNPVSIATFSGRKDPSRIKLLLAAGADPTVKNKHGYSALDTAKRTGASDLVALLEQRKSVE